MRVLCLLVVAFLFSSTVQAQSDRAENGRNLKAPPGTEQWDHFVGHWEVRGINQPPESPPMARSHAFFILDGYMMQEDYRGLDQEGNVTFRGTSLRSYDPVRQTWAIQWVPANTTDYTLIEAEVKENEITSTGVGRDGRGDFLERYRIYDITTDTHKFLLERSYDGGQSWLTYGHTISTRVTP